MEQLNMKPSINDNIAVTYHSELMDNYFSESTIDSVKGIKVLKYTAENAMIFFVDKQHVLNLLINIDDTATGWVHYNLSPEKMPVTSFDIQHTVKDNTLRIVYARRNSDSSELLVSEMINLNTIDAQRFDASLAWKQQGLPDNSRVIDHISINHESVLYSTAYKTTDAKYAYFRYGKQTVPYTLIENSPNILQLEVGQVYGDACVFLLHQMTHGTTMSYQTLPKQPGDRTLKGRFETGASINSFSIIPDTDDNSILYVAGDGLFKFNTPDAGKEEISPSGQDIHYSKIAVAEHDEEVSIWSIGEKDKRKHLYYSTNRYYDTADKIISKWTAPLMMHNDVAEFACIKGKQFINQLFLFDSSGSENALIAFWQDKVTSNWQEHPVQIEAVQEVRQAKTFTLNIGFDSDKLLLFHDEKVTIFAESNISVYINERKVNIGPETPVNAAIEGNQINVVYPTDSIASPQLRLSAPFLNKTISIDPTDKLAGRVKETFSSSKKLKATKKSDGKPLVPRHISGEQLKQATQTTSLIFNHAEGGGTAATSHPVVIHESDSNGYTLGDIWYAIKKGFIKAVKFVTQVVKDGVKLIITIGKKMCEFIVKGAQLAMQALEWVLKNTLGIDFQDIYNAFAFLFNWDDILETKNMFKGMLNNSLDGLEQSLDSFKEKVTGVADELKKMLNAPELTAHYKKMGKLSGYQQQANKLKKQHQSQQGNQMLDPRSNWVGSKKAALTSANTPASSADAPDLPQDDSFWGIITQLEKDFSLAWGELEPKFMEVLTDSITVGEFLKILVEKIAALVVDVAEKLIRGLLTLVQKLIGAAKDALNAEINVPIFTALYKRHIDKDCSLLDLVCLIIAIPVASSYSRFEHMPPYLVDRCLTGPPHGPSLGARLSRSVIYVPNQRTRNQL